MLRSAIPSSARALARSRAPRAAVNVARPAAASFARHLNTKPVSSPANSSLTDKNHSGTHSSSRITPSNKSKVWPDAKSAIVDIKNGDTVLSAGFGLCGTAETIIKAIRQSDLKDLTVVSNNAGNAGTFGLSPLITSKQIKKMILSYLGTNKGLQAAYLAGEIEVELCPQGTIAERLRAAGAGMPGFYTRTGSGTFVETGGIPQKFSPDGKEVVIPGVKKETRVFDGKKFLFEPAIHGDAAIFRAWKVDKAGNCVFRYTTRTFGPLVARAAKLSIVEAENIVEIGELDPMEIDLPGIYVDRIVPATENKEIEIVTTREDSDNVSPSSGEEVEKKEKPKSQLQREKIAKRASKELFDGAYVNLGVGIPVLAANYCPDGMKVWVQSENGILGMGPYPAKDEVDADIINAGKETVTLVDGASVFDSSESFGMIRGGHVDVSILGAMEVSANGDLANYMIPGSLVKGMGGAMDLVSNPDETKIVVVTVHTDKHGRPKIVQDCKLPLTGAGVVGRIITDLAVFDVDRTGEHGGGLELIEIAEGHTLEEIKEKTGATFRVKEPLGKF
ncbi:hypothetical protein L202_00825 [Cryptococcus amylolentus CBS 6039]|uniref:Succinyl-CoA:3-ketoacid-coenzyme A transferase n=2 Tax=Cryptococcus amylolentus TaxID=104669 RepID=A0A1E3IB46_9TREE|nr:hypothetical protein L202_00825 [Cryptococcus amylolentus CBS 6039]ODN84981.1 hypothetical protein L202_00825 [Cryptococcus amylolentus CBS 6039]ODO11323.1 hypothetical protein I350_00100 [Cryptococcus amylolentus CBS 6273]